MRLAVAATVVLLAIALAWPWGGDGGKGAGDRGSALPTTAAAPGLPEDESGPLGSQDGYVPVDESLSPFSEEPAVAELDPALLDALRRAANDAGADGIELRVNGGWRSARYQWELLQRAVETYGTLEAAKQYVLPPEESKHVTGEAVDVGPTEAAGWLFEHGSEYGLCQIYENEPWHFELATEPGGICPAMISNAAEG